MLRGHILFMANWLYMREMRAVRGALRRHILFVAMWLHFRADAGSGMGRLGATICFWSVGWMLGGLRPVGGGGRAPHVVSDQLVGFCGAAGGG